MSERTNTRPAKTPPPRSPAPSDRDTSPHTPNSKPPLKSLTRHPPLGDRDKAILSLCEGRRRELGISKSEAGRRAQIDRSDAVRALGLKSATPRTVLALARLFEIGDAQGLNRAGRLEALLIESQAQLERLAKIHGDLAALAAHDPPLG